MKTMKRPYHQKKRAVEQGRTRARIVEAAIRLHQAKGVAATSVTDIAAEAGVGKVTVYRHFRDETALVGACSKTYFGRHPFPDFEVWRSVGDPGERLRLGLAETYAYHRETEPMIARVLPEARDYPIMEPYHAHWRGAAQMLAEAWPDPARNCPILNAALALAVSFDTWRLLTDEHGLSDGEAIDLMVRLTCGEPGANKSGTDSEGRHGKHVVAD